MKIKKLAVIIATVMTISTFASTYGSMSKSAYALQPTVKHQDLTKSVTQVIPAKDPSKIPAVAKNRNDTLIVGTKVPKGQINPLEAEGLYDQYAVALCFDCLLDINVKGEPIPKIAKSWDVSKDGATYTFHLRNNIKFSDGTPLTAEDVAFTFTAMCDPKYDGPSMSYAAAIKGYKEYNTGNAATVSGIKVVNPSTLQITLNTKNASATISLFGQYILSKKYYGFTKGQYAKIKALNTKPMGCGPYKLVSFKNGQEFDFVKNSGYFLGNPKISKLIMLNTDATTSVQRIIKGETDVDIFAAKPENVQMLQQAGFINQQIFADNGYRYIGMNLKDPIFLDKKVRQALMYGLNRQAFVDSFFKGYGEVCNEPFAPVMWAYSTNVNQYKYDLAKAGKMLDAAGWKMGSDSFRYKDGKKFTFKFMFDPTSAFQNALAPILKANYQQLGVDVELVSLDFNTILDRTELKNGKRDYQTFTMGWSLTPDPDGTQIFGGDQDVAGGSNNVSFHNAESDKLLKEGLIELDQNKRKAIYQKWATLINDELPYLFIAQSQDLWGVSSRVHGLNISPFLNWTHDIYKVSIN